MDRGSLGDESNDGREGFLLRGNNGDLVVLLLQSSLDGLDGGVVGNLRVLLVGGTEGLGLASELGVRGKERLSRGHFVIKVGKRCFAGDVNRRRSQGRLIKTSSQSDFCPAV